MPTKLPNPWRVIFHPITGSTNDDAKSAIEEGLGHGTIIWALEQTKGRGRENRAWVSPKGNLYVSFILEPRDPQTLSQISFVGSVALCELLRQYGLLPTAKWPNDVLVGGQKISGILLEYYWHKLIYGIGINVASSPKEDVIYPTTSLAEEGVRYAPQQVLEDYVAHFHPLFEQWQHKGFSDIRERWQHYGPKVGDPLIVKERTERHTGTFVKLDEIGALILQQEDGTQRRFLTGDIRIE